MRSRPSFLRTLRLVLPIFVVLAVAACSGGSGGSSASPTDPAGGASVSVLTLSTSWGDVAVQTNGHPFDAGRALAAIERGYAKGRGQVGDEIDGCRLDEYHITIMPEDWNLNGQHLRDTREIRMRVGIENVLAHEVQHMFAWDLDRFSDCRTYQDHPAGYDLVCQRL
jgi:hypothetical protein